MYKRQDLVGDDKAGDWTCVWISDLVGQDTPGEGAARSP